MTAQRFTMYDVFRRNAVISPDRTAVVLGAERTSFRALLARIEALAGGLAELGLTRGERICILAQNDTAYLALYGACAKLGIIAYPSLGNFLLLDVGSRAQAVCDGLLKQGVITRPMAVWGLASHIRVSIGTDEQNDRALVALEKQLS